MLVYDCEIVKMIPNKKEEPIPNIKYCKGWGDFEGMEISVICVYDYIDNMYRVFMKDNLSELQELIYKREVMVGFNSIGFDNKLCKAHGLDLSKIQHYDLMLEIAREVNPTDKPTPSFRGCGLKACCQANFDDIDKNGDGALAPLLWQQKQYGKVVDYCLNDVKMTKALLDKVMNESICSPKDGSELKIEIFQEMKQYKTYKRI
ncbi:ribonuclease H-like domain-containing protein [Sulfurimonas sp.]|uniref:ribonuclease H-like domain-containing protein n=1 Tax=Sulfurimonas sp. TaxID=2022749 RepID=UPI0025F1A751|nr:ribonuclease H-like domain-containing protein [Sulfurimonas sp.]